MCKKELRLSKYNIQVEDSVPKTNFLIFLISSEEKIEFWFEKYDFGMNFVEK